MEAAASAAFDSRYRFSIGILANAGTKARRYRNRKQFWCIYFGCGDNYIGDSLQRDLVCALLLEP